MIARPQPADEGLSIMEVVVATVVFALTATILAGLLIQTLGLAKSNTQRTAAANIATRQMEKLRATKATNIPDGTTDTTVNVDGTTFNVRQYVGPSTADGTVCTGSGTDIVAKQITLVVTWPNMGSVQAVRSDTLRTLQASDDVLSTTKGAAAVSVQSAAGTGVSDIMVTLKTTSGTTISTQAAGPDGCVVFTGLTPGNYLATANTGSYVDQNGAQATTSSAIGVNANAISKGILPYDKFGGLLITPNSPDGSYPVPASIGVTLTTSVWSPSQNRGYPTCVGAVVSGCVSGTSTRTAASLFPTKYGAWAGTCSDAATLAGTPTLATVASGSVAAYSVTNFGRARAVIGTIGSGKRLYAVHAPDAVCSAGEVYDLGPVSTAQVVNVALPYGTWRLQLSSTGTTTQTASLSSAVSTPVTVAVLL